MLLIFVSTKGTGQGHPKTTAGDAIYIGTIKTRICFPFLALAPASPKTFAGIPGCVAGRLATGHVAHAGRGRRGDVDLLRRGARDRECHPRFRELNFYPDSRLYISSKV